jgi:hypothetical protein
MEQRKDGFGQVQRVFEKRYARHGGAGYCEKGRFGFGTSKMARAGSP